MCMTFFLGSHGQEQGVLFGWRKCFEAPLLPAELPKSICIFGPLLLFGESKTLMFLFGVHLPKNVQNHAVGLKPSTVLVGNKVCAGGGS